LIATIILACLVGLAVIYTVTGLLIVVMMARSTSTPLKSSPASLGLAYEDVAFASRVDNLKLRGWYIPGGRRGTVIIVHGGKSNRTNEPLLPLAGDFSKRDYNVLTFDRRDCGESERSSRKDRGYLERDVAGALDYIKKRSGPDEDVFIYGTSIGALAALMFATGECDLKGIVSDSTFARVFDAMGRAIGRRVGRPFSVLSSGARMMSALLYGRGLLDPIDVVSSVTVPILFIHGEEDHDIPCDDARALFKMAKNPRHRLWTVPGAGHSKSYMLNPTEYVNNIIAFFDSVAKKKTQKKPSG
jgi:pimeloyl-ACP methyl ester carboxylesterase